MSRKNNGKLPPFHPFFQRSWNAKIWKFVSTEARIVYLALCAKYRVDLDNNGRLHLSARQGAEELGFDKNIIARCLRELAYYGFIVQTNAARWHGVGIKGIAPHWRLTELSYRGEAPTYDFEHFDGELFHEQKTPTYYKRQKRYLAMLEALKASQKINLGVPNTRTPCTEHADTSVRTLSDTHPRNPRKGVSDTQVHILECSQSNPPSPLGHAGEGAAPEQGCPSAEQTVPAPNTVDGDLRGMPADLSRLYHGHRR